MDYKTNSLIELIYQEIENFIRDWQASPYEWNTEVEMQAEIYNRLVKKLISNLIQKAKYKVKDDRFKEGQNYRRICCEPLIFYLDKSGEICHCFPDIVVYDDIDNPDSPPDFRGEANWPMLWVCEIKYQNEFSGGTSRDNKNWDSEKIKYLLEYEKGKAKFACFLDFDRTKPNSDKNFSYEDDNNFRQYRIMLPK